MTRPGRHFLQIPGPTNVPDRILRAIDQPVIDHRGAEFTSSARSAGESRPIFQTAGHVIIYPGSGTGAGRPPSSTPSPPGDRVVIFETGHFSQLWRQLAERFGIEVDYVPGNWRRGVDLPN